MSASPFSKGNNRLMSANGDGGATGTGSTGIMPNVPEVAKRMI
jgi:hypothetical protein